MADENSTKPVTKPAPKKRTTAKKAVTTKPRAKIAAKPAPKTAGDKMAAGKAGATPANDYLSSVGERAAGYATDIKQRASDAMENIGKLIEETAEVIDDNVGPKFGDYARTASHNITKTAERLRDKDVTEIGSDARDFARKSPALTAGIAAIASIVVVQAVRSALKSDK